MGIGSLSALVAAVALALPAGAPAAFAPAKNGEVIYRLQAGMFPDIWAISGDGSGPRNLTVTPTLTERDPSISPDGRSLAFTFFDGGTDTDIVVRTLPAGPDVNLTEPDSPRQESHPAFSADGRTIVYQATVEGVTDIFAMNADGSNRRNLTNTPLDDEALPSVSADGRFITYTRFDGQNDIWVMNFDGTGQRNLTQTAAPVGEFDSDFSPDGRRIVFVRVAAGDCDVYGINSDGSGLQNLTQTPLADECDPTYSADGKKVLYARSDASQLDLWTMRPDGSGQGKLTKTPAPANEEAGVWEAVYRCGGRRATIVGDAGPDTIKGTKKRDVIVSNAGKDVVRGRGGNDLICLGAGKDRVIGGKGRDLCRGGKGEDRAKGCEGGKF